MAVSSSGKFGWDLWREAWQEKFKEGQLSLYDRTFINSPYADPDIDRSKNHFVSLPGLVAFLYYPRSLWFLFAALVVFGLLGSFLELVTYRFGGQNLILCSLIAQVIAYRYAGFGYVPSQSYLMFGTLALNVLIFFAAERVCRAIFSKTTAGG